MISPQLAALAEDLRLHCDNPARVRTVAGLIAEIARTLDEWERSAVPTPPHCTRDDLPGVIRLDQYRPRP